MRPAVTIAVVVAIYAVVEAAWLLTMRPFYAKAFAPLLRPPGTPLKVRSLTAVVLVYPLLVAAYVILVLLPLMAKDQGKATGEFATSRAVGWILYGLIFGAVVYGVYNLTNMATLPGYSWTLVGVDTAWGTACFGGLAGVASWLVTA